MSGGVLEVHGRIENWQRVRALLFQEPGVAKTDEQPSGNSIRANLNTV